MSTRQRNPKEVTSSNFITPLRTEYLPQSTQIGKAAERVLRAKQELAEQLQAKPHIVRQIITNGTLQIEFIADWHIGHEATNYDQIIARLEYIQRHPNVGVIFLGDLIEGMKPEYMGTVVGNTPLNTTEQVAYLQTLITPLIEQGKILAMVTDYDGHSGWSRKQATVDIYQQIRGNTDVPFVQNGGRLTLEFIDPNSSPQHPKILGTKHLDLYHTPPSGSTDQNPTAGLVKAGRRKKSLAPALSASGHIHKGAYSIEIDANGDEMIAIQEGTPKGSNRDIPRDMFFVGKIPDKRPHPPGSSVTIRPNMQAEKLLMRPAYGADQTDTLRRTYEFLDRTEQLGITQELNQQVLSQAGQPQRRLMSKQSLKEDDSSLLETQAALDEKELELEQDAEIQSPTKPDDQFRKVVWNISSNLPIAVFFGSHFSIGSSTAESKRYKILRETFADTVESNPYAFLILLRNLLDRTTSKRTDRRHVVESAAQLFENIANDMRVLGLMLGGEDFRHNSWKQSITGDGPFMPGTFLSQRWNTALINHMSEVQINLSRTPNGKKSQDYKILTLDKVGRRGSSVNTFNGLRAIEANYPDEVDIVAGGHMPNAGVLAAQDPYSATNSKTYVAPGHFTKFEGQGKGNRQDASPGGQGVILYPHRKSVVGFGKPEEGIELLTAAQNYEAAQQDKSLFTRVMESSKNR